MSGSDIAKGVWSSVVEDSFRSGFSGIEAHLKELFESF